MSGRFAWARLGLLALVLVSCVGCDQYTKHVARQTLDGQPSRSYLGDTFRLIYTENPGAFLGLGGQMSPTIRWTLLVVVNSIVAAVIAGLVIFHPRLRGVPALACVLLLAGAMGNLIDRLRFDGLVIDFMNLGIGPLRTGIFNVADVAISVGAVLLILPQFALRKTPPPSDPGKAAA